MVSGNIMGSGVFLLPANLASTGGIAIYGWLVTIIGALGLSMVYAKMSFLDPSPGGSYAYARRCFGPFLGYQTNVLYWLACWIGNIAMVVIGVGYLSYFFPILKDPLVLTITCVVVLWIFVLLNIVGPKMITRVQAVATVLALILHYEDLCRDAIAKNVELPALFAIPARERLGWAKYAAAEEYAANYQQVHDEMDSEIAALIEKAGEDA